MKKLIVAEKPSVGRDIARVLGVKGKGEGFLDGDNYCVTWAIGHLVTLQEPDEIDERYKKWRMDTLPILPETIPLKVLPKTKTQFNTVKKLMNSREFDSIICATDSAREGELIFRYIYQMAGCKKPVERLWISSMTDAAIRQGFADLKPASAYDSLYASARCRSEADWLVGMNASRAFTLKYDVLLSVGRVQTPTLALLVRRDLEIERFVPKDYWELRADFGDYTGLYWDPETKEARIYDKERAERIRREVAGKPAVVVESERERKRMPPPQLFDLTTLQREANRRYGFSADKTLKLAQELYEKHKLLTYPRTDSRYLPPDMQGKVAQALKALPEPLAAFVHAPELNWGLRSSRVYDASKISDHHAIVPTEKKANLSALSPDEAKLYDMVARRLIAVHYPNYEYEAARIMTRAEGHLFKSTGSTPLVEGWRALYRDEEADRRKEPEAVLPRLAPGDERKVERTSIKALKTKPPLPHTDASLLSAMENCGREIADEALREQMKSSGLGTPATRAATIERLIQVGYARRRGKTLVSTEKGRKLIEVAPEQITSAVTTGKWEKWLSEMAALGAPEQRQDKAGRFMQGIRRFSVFLVDAAKAAPADVRFPEEERRKAPARRAAAGTRKRTTKPTAKKG